MFNYKATEELPGWFQDYLNYVEGLKQDDDVNVSERLEVTENSTILLNVRTLCVVAKGRARIDFIGRKGSGNQYSVSLPSWVILNASRAGGDISIANPAYSSDAPRVGDLVRLGASLATRSITKVVKFDTYTALTVSGGHQPLPSGERVRLIKETIVIHKV